uniref:Mediator of RNA polymerase II transcription subunit 15 n=1 Tax=Pseudonaja textilis TaxID=8673 RepID=A0A670ZWN5_PSETE
MEDSDWRSANFRQKLVSQIEEAMRKAGVAHTKTSKEMENHVFMKAKTRDEYLSLVARLIIHFRDIHNKKSLASVSGKEPLFFVPFLCRDASPQGLFSLRRQV